MEVKVEGGLGQWLRDKCQKDNLSLRQASAKTGLCHVTIQAIMNGRRPSPATVKKLASGFISGNHQKSKLALEDHLLTLAGHRTQRPEEAVSEPLARLLDRMAGFNESQLGLMGRFADFISKMEAR